MDASSKIIMQVKKREDKIDFENEVDQYMESIVTLNDRQKLIVRELVLNYR